MEGDLVSWEHTGSQNDTIYPLGNCLERHLQPHFIRDLALPSLLGPVGEAALKHTCVYSYVGICVSVESPTHIKGKQPTASTTTRTGN